MHDTLFINFKLICYLQVERHLSLNFKFQNILIRCTNMIGLLRQRPQSRSYRSQTPIIPAITRQVDKEQGQKCFLVGKEHQNRSQLSKAKEFYLQAIVHDSNHFKAYCNLGSCLRAQSNFSAAISAYEKALQINSEDSITNYNLANTCRIIGDEERAIQLYQKVIGFKEKKGIDIGSVYLNSYINLGICFQNMGRYNDALACYQKSRNIDPKDQEIVFNSAICLKKTVYKLISKKQACKKLILETIQKTQDLIKKILENDKCNQVAILSLIELKHLRNLQSQKILNECIKEYTELSQKSESSAYMKEQSLRLKAYCLNLLKKYDQSAQNYKKALQSKKKQETLAKAKHGPSKSNLYDANNNDQQSLQKNDINKNYKSTEAKPQRQVNQSSKSVSKEATAQQQSLRTKELQTPKPKIRQNFIRSDQYYKTLNELVEILNQGKSEQSLQKLDKLNYDDQTKNQLKIIIYSIISEKQADSQAMQKAYDIYFNYFLKANLQSKIHKQMFSLEAHRAMASILTHLGQNQQAIVHYQIINEHYEKNHIKQQSSLQQLYSGLGTNYENQGLHSQAIEQFKKALELNPSNIILLYNLGYCHQCKEELAQAKINYELFIEKINAEQTLDQQSKSRYILQCSFNILNCLTDQTQKKQKCEYILTLIRDHFQNSVSDVLRQFNNGVVLGFYLTAADCYEHSIEIAQRIKQGDNRQKIQNLKQKLIHIYMALLQIPQVPDREQILINCGNIFYEEKEFISSLSFYQNLEKHRDLASNNIGLAYFNLHEHSRALYYINNAVQTQPENQIYKINQQIMNWVYGLQKQIKNNRILKQYPCSCESQFSSRLQFGKCLIQKLTNKISNLFGQQTFKHIDLNQEQNVNKILQSTMSQSNDQGNWMTAQLKQKFKAINNYLKTHLETSHQSIKEVSKENWEKSFLIVFKKYESEQLALKGLGSLFSFLEGVSELHTDYYTFIASSISFLILNLSANQIVPNKQKLKELLKDKIASSKKIPLNLKDEFTNSGEHFKEKLFKIKYPELQLKVKNIVQTLINWQGQFEDEVGYLYRIIENIAYECQVAKPIQIDYTFPHCKNIDQCQSCFNKISKLSNQMLYMENSLNAELKTSINQSKIEMINQFISKFPKQITTKVQNQQLRMKLSEDLLPIEFTLNFKDYKHFQTFFKAIGTFFGATPELQSVADRKQVFLTFNKLIQIKCIWQTQHFLNQIVNDMIKNPLSLTGWALINNNLENQTPIWSSMENVTKELKQNENLFKLIN